MRRPTKKILKSLISETENTIIENLYIKCMLCKQIKPIKETVLIQTPYNIGLSDNKLIASTKVGLFCKTCVEKGNIKDIK